MYVGNVRKTLVLYHTVFGNAHLFSPFGDLFWSTLANGPGEKCLLGDRSQLRNMSSKEFSVIMVGITVAARTILKHW